MVVFSLRIPLAFGYGWHPYSYLEISSQMSMILPTYPGKIPQTSPNPHKERNSFINCWWNLRGIFQGYVGEILENGDISPPVYGGASP